MTIAEQKRHEQYKLAYDAFMLCYPFNPISLPEEIWVNVPDYEGLYQISNFGRIKSFHNTRIKILKPSLSQFGYLVVDLHKNGQHKNIRVHVLVAKVFVPNLNNKPEVDHLFGNKLDCCAKNLDWVTSQENHQRASNIGLKSSGENHVHSKLTDEQVRYIRNVYISRDSKFGVRALARQFNINHKTISSIINGKLYKSVK